MFDHLLELSHRDDSNKWSNIGFGKEIDIIEILTLSGALVISIDFICYFSGNSLINTYMYTCSIDNL